MAARLSIAPQLPYKAEPQREQYRDQKSYERALSRYREAVRRLHRFRDLRLRYFMRRALAEGLSAQLLQEYEDCPGSGCRGFDLLQAYNLEKRKEMFKREKRPVIVTCEIYSGSESQRSVRMIQ